jgi:hypothetical protein
LNEADALKKMEQASYLAGGGAHYQAPSFQLGGQMRTAPSFSFAPQAPSAGVMDAASGLEGQMADRLRDPGFKPDWSYKPSDVNEYANPDTLEKISGYGGRQPPDWAP